MRIKSIHAKNFRTLEDFHLELGSYYCAISGRNNAGKSAIVSIIQWFLEDNDSYRYSPFSQKISFEKDHTQWADDNPTEICIEVVINKDEDSELLFVLERLSRIQILNAEASVKIFQIFEKDGQTSIRCVFDDNEMDSQISSEILKKFKSSPNLIVHNSTVSSSRRIFFISDSYTEVLETHFSSEDRKRISDAQTRLQNSVRKAAKQHKEELDKLLGRLNEKYHVELSSIEGGVSSKFPLEVKLNDKSVDISLTSWGTGTQNRTRILISVLEAIRMRSSASAENRTTPVFIVEEPESFLHPSAQAEFGKVLNGIAKELNIQIIATTHSPYMLNQSDPNSNYLLERRIFRNIPKDTVVRNTAGDEWMVPFAENLGIVPKEFENWRDLFGTHTSKVILVEGDIDQSYFTFIAEKYPDAYAIPEDVEIVPYGGKDALKNTSILQFMINKFGRVFITFDLDSEQEVSRALERIGLKREQDFCGVGKNSPGSDCIEGLLPSRIKQRVYAEHHEVVTAMTSQDTSVRKSAKSKLKMEFLKAFKGENLNSKDLEEFKNLFKKIGKAFN